MISIIIPVYNGEKALEQCLTSLQNQTYSDLEVLMVDDGSTDGSRKICKRFEKADSRFRYLYQQNSGVSAARNAGLAAATGDYIGFCDADDWVDSDMYAFLLELMTAHKADVAVCSFYRDTPVTAAPPRHSHEIHTYTAMEAVVQMHQGVRFAGHLCDKLFSRAVIGNKQLPADITILEDMTFLWDVLLDSRLVVQQDVTKYHYIQSTSSAMNRFKESAWSVQIACDRMLSNMERHCPNQLAWAQRTALYGNITLARQLSEAKLLTAENYRRVRAKLDASFNHEALSRLTPTYARLVKVFRMGRGIFNGFIGLLTLKHRLTDPKRR